MPPHLSGLSCSNRPQSPCDILSWSLYTERKLKRRTCKVAGVKGVNYKHCIQRGHENTEILPLPFLYIYKIPINITDNFFFNGDSSARVYVHILYSPVQPHLCFRQCQTEPGQCPQEL